MMEFRVKMEAPSTPNLREHHFVRAKRVKKQRGQVTRKMPNWTGGPVLHVRITRISARELDKDNVQGAMKSVRDAVASRLRIDDATRLVEWHYQQAKGDAEVVVQIWRDGDEAPPVPNGTLMTERLKAALDGVDLPGGSRLRSPPRSGSKAGRIDYVEAYTPPRSKPMDAAKEAEETFAPPVIPEWAQLECSRSPCNCHRPHKMTP